MATKPTRQQERACDLFAGSLANIAEGARLAGKGPFPASDLADLASRLARASVAFSVDELLARALEVRSRGLGLPSGTAEMLTLLDLDRNPVDLLVIDDEAFREVVRAMEQELGDA
jgi:hypothetical protein